jgi:hypothetical protein
MIPKQKWKLMSFLTIGLCQGSAKVIYSFVTLCSVDSYLERDVSGQPVGPIFKGDGTDRFSRNFVNYLPMCSAYYHREKFTAP